MNALPAEGIPLLKQQYKLLLSTQENFKILNTVVILFNLTRSFGQYLS